MMRCFGRALFVVGLFALAIAAGFYFLLALIFWEGDNVRYGTFAYFVHIPSKAKYFPLLKPCGQPTFGYRFQDGLSPETYWLTYGTGAQVKALVQHATAYALAESCQLSKAADQSDPSINLRLTMTCPSDPPRIELTVMKQRAPVHDCRKLQILFVEELD